MSLGQEFQNESFEIECRDRWVVFQRLQELDIPCTCGYYQPLSVQVHSGVALIQIWTVLKRSSASRSLLIHHLERCWQNYGLLNP